MLRYSLATLLSVVLLVSLGFAALANASAIWAQLAVSITLLALLAATTSALFSRGGRRAFCGGFALVGWPYFLIVVLPAAGVLKMQLLTSKTVDALYGVMHPDGDQQDMLFRWLLDSPTVASSSYYALTMASIDGEISQVVYFASIGQMLWTILLAGLGGAVALGFWRRQASIRGGDVSAAPAKD